MAEGATHVGIFKGGCKVAFTLAEVLITLGIIGVVAAMTIPTLITKFLCLDNILLTVISQVLMARWKISNNFV